VKWVAVIGGPLGTVLSLALGQNRRTLLRARWVTRDARTWWERIFCNATLAATGLTILVFGSLIRFALTKMNNLTQHRSHPLS